MSVGAPAIPAPGPFPGSHAPPIGQLRVARRPGRPHSGPLRAFQPQRHTLGTPLKPLRPPSTPFPSAAGSARAAAPALPACSARLFRSRRLDQQSKFDGRSRSLSGQCVHQAGVAVLDGVAGDRPVIEFSNEVRPHSALDGRTPAAAYRGVAEPGQQMASRHGEQGRRWQLRVPREEDEREHNPVTGVIHNVHRIKLPLPRTPSPFYRHLFLTARGALTITRIYLNLPPRSLSDWSRFAVKCGQHTSPLARFTRNFREYRVLVSPIGCDFPAYGLLAA